MNKGEGKQEEREQEEGEQSEGEQGERNIESSTSTVEDYFSEDYVVKMIGFKDIDVGQFDNMISLVKDYPFIKIDESSMEEEDMITYVKFEVKKDTPLL